MKERKYYWSKITSGGGETLWMSPPCRTKEDAQERLDNALEVFDFPALRYQKVVSVKYTFKEEEPKRAN